MVGHASGNSRSPAKPASPLVGQIARHTQTLVIGTQVIGQVTIEYMALMVYSVAGGAGIGVWPSRPFIQFFQTADQDILNPPKLLPMIAWEEIGRISGAFTIALIVAQVIVITAALRGGVFQALRMGDRE